MLSLAAAVSAPLRTRSQNVSPGTSWVIIAMVARGVSAVPAPIPDPEESGFPPVLEQAARPKTTTEGSGQYGNALASREKRHVNSLSTSTNGPREQMVLGCM